MLSNDIMKENIGLTKVTNYSLNKNGPFHKFVEYRNNKGFLSIVDNCSVDIIIPYHCCYNSVRNLVLSILQYTKSNPYQITLIDDGSPGDAALDFIQAMRQAPQTECIRSETQKGFGHAVNLGINSTSQPYICVIHSDCEIQNLDWLERMGEALVLNKKNQVRMICSRSDNPGEDDISILKTSFLDMLSESNEKIIEISDEPLPMYCFMCHRDLFKRVGLIKQYPYTYYENQEFFYRMQHFGFKQAIATKSWVHHKKSETMNFILRGNKNASQIEKEIQKNRHRCIEDLRLLYKQQSRMSVFQSITHDPKGSGLG